MEGVSGSSKLVTNISHSLTDSEPEDDSSRVTTLSDGSRKRSGKNTSGSQVKKRKFENVYECSVCLSNIKDKRMGNPSGCKHNFCLPCIKRWAKDNFTCPLDRLSFDWINIIDRVSDSLIKRVDREGKLITVPCIPTCSLCSMSENPKLMISCDGCSAQFHIGCLANPESVSILSWLCSLCNGHCLSEIDEDVCRANSSVRSLVLQRYRIHLHAMSMKKNHPIKCKASNSRNVGFDKILTPALNQATKSPAKSPLELPISTHELVTQTASSEPQDVLFDIMVSLERTFHDRNPGLGGKPVPVPPTIACPSQVSSSSSPSSSSSSSGSSLNIQKSRLSFVERIAKDILMPFYMNKTVSKEKAKQILKIVVPKVCKETSPSVDHELLRHIVQEKVLVWLDIL